jgi:2-C-methyl-D-erythritol 4-phosphate cytidylyltransferase
MGQPRAKAFLPLGDIPLLAHTLQRFEACPQIDEILPLVPEEEILFCQEEVVRRFGLKKVSQPLAGGPERGESVYRGLREIQGRADGVVIHDGVRPFVSPELIARAVAASREWKAIAAAIPAGETIKEVSTDREVIRTLERRKIWLVQTPQVFEYRLIWEAYQRAQKDGFQGTDDAVLVERLGVPVRIIEGSKFNIKITTAEDMILAEALSKTGVWEK